MASTPSHRISNPQSFREEARFQRTCARCGAGGDHHAHHAVPKQVLKGLGLAHKLYDPRNALRLCEGLDGKRCHMQFEKRMVVVETTMLTGDNICFVWEVLGVAGYNFLDRTYSGAERRFTRHEEGLCPLCQ